MPFICDDVENIINVVRAVGLLRTIPPSTMELVTGYGEVWSAMMMHFIFNISYNKNIKNIGNLIALKVYPEMASGTMSKRVMAKLKL